MKTFTDLKIEDDNIVGYRLIPIHRDEYCMKPSDWLNRPNRQEPVKCMATGKTVLPLGGPQDMVISQEFIRTLREQK